MPDTQPSKRRGRPRVTEEQKKRHTLTFRMRDDLRDAIEEMAIIDKNTLSEQIESYVHSGVYAQAALMYEYQSESLSPAILRYIQVRETSYGLRYNKLETAFDESAEHMEDPKPRATDTLIEVKSRLSEQMHAQLQAEAEANKRSMNAEIVARLEHTLFSGKLMEAAGASRGDLPPKDAMLEMVHTMYIAIEKVKELKETGLFSEEVFQEALAKDRASRQGESAPVKRKD